MLHNKIAISWSISVLFVQEEVLMMCSSLLNVVGRGFHMMEGFYDLWLYCKGDGQFKTGCLLSGTEETPLL